MNDHKTLREMWEEADSSQTEQHARMLEDLKFSNPTDPEQWDPKAKLAREHDTGGVRPTYCFDQTNQYIAQVVNDARKNKPQIQTVPATSRGGAVGLSEAVDGVIRHIEYMSSASIVYDTTVEHAARIGLGWSGLIPVVCDPGYNEQEIRIRRFHDPLAVKVDPHFVSPDGEDIDFGFVETSLGERLYKRRYGSRAFTNWAGKDVTQGWGTPGGGVRIAEAFWKEKKKTSKLLVTDPDDATGRNRKAITETAYWDVAKKTGTRLQYHSQFEEEETTVYWAKMDGHDFLGEPTVFPCDWVPLFPTMGYELWVDGKRYLCGMVRRMRPGQQAYNLERNTELEWMAKQPRAPYIVPWAAVANHQKEWQSANTSNDAYLPYDHLDGDGNELPAPNRLAPPSPGAAFTNLGQKGIADLQASVGMYRANLGAPSNETSGIAIRRREEQGDTANFHYLDNQSRTMTHMGRCIVNMVPKVMTTKRVLQILNLDGSTDSVTFDPQAPQPVTKEGKKVTVINFGSADLMVRCKVGPAYSSLREETADALTKIVQGNPTLMTVLGPMWARMQDWPEAEHLSKLLLAIAPPPIQAIESDESDMSPVAMAQIEQAKGKIAELERHMKALSEALEEAAKQHDAAEAKAQQADMRAASSALEADEARVDGKAKRDDALVKQYDAETKRLAQLMPFVPPELIQIMVWQLLRSTMTDEPIDTTMPLPPMPQFQAPASPDQMAATDASMAGMMDSAAQPLEPEMADGPPLSPSLPAEASDGLPTAPQGDETFQ